MEGEQKREKKLSVISGEWRVAFLYLPLRHSLLRAGVSAQRAVWLQWASHTEGKQGRERERRDRTLVQP